MVDDAHFGAERRRDCKGGEVGLLHRLNDQGNRSDEVGRDHPRRSGFRFCSSRDSCLPSAETTVAKDRKGTLAGGERLVFRGAGRSNGMGQGLRRALRL